MVIVGYYVNDIDGVSANKIFMDTLDKFSHNGIEVLDCSLTRMIIQTPRVYIQFFTDSNKLNGRRFDELFGEIPFDKKIGRFKNPGDRYEGTLLEYVTEIEYGGC